MCDAAAILRQGRAVHTVDASHRDRRVRVPKNTAWQQRRADAVRLRHLRLRLALLLPLPDRAGAGVSAGCGAGLPGRGGQGPCAEAGR